MVLASGLTLSGTVAMSGLAGAIAGGTAVWLVRAVITESDRFQQGLIRPFTAVAMVIAGAAVGLPAAAGPLRAGVVSVVLLVTFLLAFVPWNVFALRYAGRGNLLTRRRILAVGALVAILLVAYLSVAVGILQPSRESYSSVLLTASTLLLGLLAITFVSGGLVLTAAYRHGNVSVAHGMAVVFPVAVLLIGIQIVSLSDVLTRELLASFHLFAVAAALPVAIGRYDVLTTRPGTTTLGERAVIEDLDEAVLVLNQDGAIILYNQQAEYLFGANLDGQALAEVVGTDIMTLRELSTLECWTDQGYKRFDPRVSTVTGGRERAVGQTLTLIDVTDQEMLRQRVQVLNRILRHNIRNDLDVIKSHAEFALMDVDDDQSGKETRANESVAQILEVADEVLELSADARQIEQLTRNSPTEQSVVNLPRLVDEVVETVIEDQPDLSVMVEIPQVELSVARGFLWFALQNLVVNAVEHNDSPSPRVEIEGTERKSEVRIVVRDNGPGIPDAEWQVIQAGQEEALNHATSLGLWGTKWTVQKMGGRLSRRETDSGAAVIIDLPTNTYRE
jgi:signal transduction histidine kinase